MAKRGLLTTGDRCDECFGNGVHLDPEHLMRVDEVRMKTCVDCAGLGVELTDIGRELVGFLKEHFHITPKNYQPTVIPYGTKHE